MIKINQSYAYDDEQNKWLKENMSKNNRTNEQQKKSIVDDFYQKFGINRGYEALRVQAVRLGYRRKKSDIKIGVTRKKGKKGECDYVAVSLNPVKYQRESRYLYEKHHGVKLKPSDAVVFKDQDHRNLSIDNLVLLKRSEVLAFNNLSSDIPAETRILIAKINMSAANLTGKGDWTEEEKEWLFRKKDVDSWVELANIFNAKFKKNRSNRDLIMMYYAEKRKVKNETNRK